MFSALALVFSETMGRVCFAFRFEEGGRLDLVEGRTEVFDWVLAAAGLFSPQDCGVEREVCLDAPDAFEAKKEKNRRQMATINPLLLKADANFLNLSSSGDALLSVCNSQDLGDRLELIPAFGLRLKTSEDTWREKIFPFF
jgi:hypothetical protein